MTNTLLALTATVAALAAAGATAHGVRAASATDPGAEVRARAKAITAGEEPRTIPAYDADATPAAWDTCMAANGAPEYARVTAWIASGRDPQGARQAWITLTGTAEFQRAHAVCETQLPAVP